METRIQIHWKKSIEFKEEGHSPYTPNPNLASSPHPLHHYLPKILIIEEKQTPDSSTDGAPTNVTLNRETEYCFHILL
jgi:hypothetical protein